MRARTNSGLAGGRHLGRRVAGVDAPLPGLEEQANRFASPPIRNSATLCGNLANGSPIGDSIPAMLALGAELECDAAPWCGAYRSEIFIWDT